MDASIISRLRDQEPALLTALVTMIGGFVAQVGPGHISSLKALGTSVSVSGIQGLLTREHVISPATFRAGSSAATGLDVRSMLAHGAEPALAMSLVGLLTGFLLQVVGGSTDLLQALGIAAGLSGTQGVITRQQVYSPRTALVRQLAARTGLAAAPPIALAGGLSALAMPVAGAPTAAPAAAIMPAAPRDVTADPGSISRLQRYRPEVRYDSLESFFADWAAILTDRPGNVLRRQDGSIIATATPTPGIPKLSLDFLHQINYANGEPAAQSDFIEEVGTDYVAQAALMHARPGYGDRVHGRVVLDSSGATWLQYWFFMYYDDPGFLGFGTHEGDLEMIQLRLDAGGQPDAASYSQHRSGVRATWGQLELAATPDGPVPVTYSARGSHANLLRAGQQISTRSFLPDHNDGRGPRVRPTLVPLSGTDTPWCLWPGSWGGTKASGIFGQVGIAANSPTAPNRHLAWNDPAAFHASFDLPEDLPAQGQPMGLDLLGPPQPQLTPKRAGGEINVQFTVPPDGKSPPPTKVIVGVVSKDGTAPAHTASIELRGDSGMVTLPAPSGPNAEVRATAHAENGLASTTAVAPLPPGP